MVQAVADFQVVADYQPAGDQPTAIAALIDGIESGLSHQTLLGVTGSGKTFTIANVVQAVQRPTLILAPNKTLAAQLYGEGIIRRIQVIIRIARVERTAGPSRFAGQSFARSRTGVFSTRPRASGTSRSSIPRAGPRRSPNARIVTSQVS